MERSFRPRHLYPHSLAWMDGPMTALSLVLDLRQIRDDACSGKLATDALVGIIERQQHTIDGLLAERRRLRERLALYESEASHNPADPAPKPDAPYSVDAENKRRCRRQRRKKSPGRTPTAMKVAAAQRVEDIYPQGVRSSDCTLVRQRAIWLTEQGGAVRVGYRIFAGPDGREPRIPGVTPRCEYGMEVLVVLAFLVYLIGISLDKACVVMEFFCQLPLSKSQADALLRQLATHWDEEFDTL